MAIPADPNFGSDFNEAEFRAAIKSTMQMGMPNAIKERATFIWKDEAAYAVSDFGGDPLDFNSPTTSGDEIKKGKQLQVECAYETVSRVGTFTPIGDFENPTARIYLADDAYAQVKTAWKVILGGNTYSIKYTEPPVSLFAFTLYTIYAQADDES